MSNEASKDTPYWNDNTPCADCADERSAHKKGEGPCSACDACKFFVRPVASEKATVPPERGECFDCKQVMTNRGGTIRDVVKLCSRHRSYDAQLSKLREALRGVRVRVIEGWGLCWCEENWGSTNICDHTLACAAAREAIKGEE